MRGCGVQGRTRFPQFPNDRGDDVRARGPPPADFFIHLKHSSISRSSVRDRKWGDPRMRSTFSGVQFVPLLPKHFDASHERLVLG